MDSGKVKDHQELFSFSSLHNQFMSSLWPGHSRTVALRFLPLSGMLALGWVGFARFGFGLGLTAAKPQPQPP